MKCAAWIVWLAFTGAFSATVPVKKAPSFDCVDRAGNVYDIWLAADPNLLRIKEKGKVRDIPLSGENIGRDLRSPEEPRAYNAWKGKGSSLFELLDLSTEFSTQYLVQGGTSRVKVSLVIDHREPEGLSCKPSGIAVKVVVDGDEAPTHVRHAAVVSEGATLRHRDGTLTAVGLMLVEAGIRRMVNSSDSKRKDVWDKFISLSSNPLKSIDLRSIRKLEERLSKDLASTLASILADIRYDIYPIANRYATWFKEGVQPGPKHSYDSMVAGIEEFVASSGYRDRNIRDFFVTDITLSLALLSEEEAREIGLGLTAPSRGFFTEIWSRAVGKRTLAETPEIEEMAREIGEIVEAKEFEPQRFQGKVSAFLKSSKANDVELRRLFLEATSPYAKQLTPRQREDVMGWLDAKEKKFFQEMLRSNN